MPNEKDYQRSESDPRLSLKARLEKRFADSLKRKPALELAQAPPDLGDWEIFAMGPWQDPTDLMPGRIIIKGEKAYIFTVVWLNDLMCRNITDLGAKIELRYFTSNTQTMEAVPELNFSCCIETKLDQCWYGHLWEFEPLEAACIYETNICARICNCNNIPGRQYAGFVRHVYDFDPELLWPPPPPTLYPPPVGTPPFPDPPGFPPPNPSVPPSWGFDRPIRYMVAEGRGENNENRCDCDNNNCDDQFVSSE